MKGSWRMGCQFRNNYSFQFRHIKIYVFASCKWEIDDELKKIVPTTKTAKQWIMNTVHESLEMLDNALQTWHHISKATEWHQWDPVHQEQGTKTKHAVRFCLSQTFLHDNWTLKHLRIFSCFSPKINIKYKSTSVLYITIAWLCYSLSVVW